MGSRARQHEQHEHEEHAQTLVEESTAILEEARMVLPGIQALFGFQLVVIFDGEFWERVGATERSAHLVAIGLVILAIVLVMAPAAYQRQAEAHIVTRRFVVLASRLLRAGMAALAASIAIDFFLVAHVITQQLAVAIALGISAATLATLAWFVLPALARARAHRVRRGGRY